MFMDYIELQLVLELQDKGHRVRVGVFCNITVMYL